MVKPARNSAIVPSLALKIIVNLLPEGVVNVVTGSAQDTGDALVGHPLVRKVNFTGSVPVGKHVMRVASRNLAPVTLELGGNDAALILEDAELSDEVFQKMHLVAFASSGQICMAIKCLHVHASRCDEVVDGFRTVCDKAVVGDGLLPETTMGPVNNAAQLKVVTDMIADARAKDADVVETGQIPDPDLYHGGDYFQRPTLVLNADHDLSTVKKEEFGPALPIMKFRDENEAIGYANNSDFGLCSSVWTPNPGKALRV